jgi:hypothetical protein
VMTADEILSILDRCCDVYTLPMLDNGYVYLAATRLSLYRSATDWAIVIEVFGYSVRAGLPDTHIYTFASALHDRKTAEDYVSREAYERYVVNNPHNESRFIHPIDAGDWQDEEEFTVAEGATEFVLRRQRRAVPSVDEYARRGIELEQPPKVAVFEFCRCVAAVDRELVLATADERRGNVLPEMERILQLEEWHHPDVVEEDQRPSGSETFRQLAQVLVTGNVSLYAPTLLPNTHWKNWPEGGLL